MKTAKELETIVAKMRELGVTEFDGIKLGPEPMDAPKPPTEDEKRVRAEERAVRNRDIQFAACRVRPLVRAVKP